jgi:glycosyltransferase involved in cell wall biosynthesis
LIENEELRKNIGEYAYKKVNKEFSINEIGKNFINDLKKYLEEM